MSTSKSAGSDAEIELASSICEYIKYFCCFIIVHLLILVVFVGIANSYCTLQTFPIVNFIILFCTLTLIAYVEGLHYGCVQVSVWDKAVMQDYPRALKYHHLIDSTKKVKQFLVGRQFFLIFAVFLLSQVTSFPHIPSVRVICFC